MLETEAATGAQGAPGNFRKLLKNTKAGHSNGHITSSVGAGDRLIRSLREAGKPVPRNVLEFFDRGLHFNIFLGYAFNEFTVAVHLAFCVIGACLQRPPGGGQARWNPQKKPGSFTVGDLWSGNMPNLFGSMPAGQERPPPTATR